jgi:hypothetical protein
MLSSLRPRAIALPLLALALGLAACHAAADPGPATDPRPAGGPASVSRAPDASTASTPPAPDAPASRPPAGPASAASASSPAPGGPASAGGALDVRWSFPALIPDPARGSVLPTYLAHLLGRPLDHPFPTDLVCVDVDNPGRRLAATLTIAVAVYAEDATRDIELPPGPTHACLTPPFDLPKLYGLRAATPGRIEASLAVRGAVVGAAMQPISISPVDEVAWHDGDIAFDDMRALATVFVTPADPKVDQLQRLAASASAFGRFGNGADAYERDPVGQAADLDPETWWFEQVFVERGEAIGWTLSSVSGGDDVVDVYLFTPDQYDAWREGDARDATEVWTNQPAGASGRVVEPPGAYVLVIFNAETYAPVSVSWSRDVTREDVAEDALRSIYTALQAMHTTYSDISSSFFEQFQHVRRPSEVLDALSANCLDGSLLFASVLELVGMSPVLVFKTGHAYVGVRSAPGSNVVWPVETTMVGTSDFSAAFAKAQDELSDDSRNDPRFQLVDVPDARARGILPIVE